MRGPGKGNTNNPNGRPPGARNERTKQWEQLGADIVTTHAERFNRVLATLEDEDFVKIYKDILNYFKPKINHNINEQTEPTKIIFENVSKENIDQL